MRYPQLLVLSPDSRLEAELRELAAKRRWILRAFRQERGILALLQQPRPTVLLIVLDPEQPSREGLSVLSACQNTLRPWPIVVVFTRKISEPQRATWVAALLDLGATSVVMPPIIRPVLEEIVITMIEAEWPELLPQSRAVPGNSMEAAIELAAGEYEEK
mgnify:CR=1 FL=1